MKTLIFDMDDTLIVEEASAEAALMATCQYATNRVCADAVQLCRSIRESCRDFWHDSPARRYCLDVGISSWEGLWAEFSGNDKNLRILSDWAPTYRLDSWEEALRRCGHQTRDGLARELADRFVQERRKLHIVYDDVVPVLEELQQYHRLGLLTNGVPDLQRRKLNGSGLTGYFDAVVISGEVGFGKPNTQIFELILERLDATPDSSAMIGNSLKSDMAPALELGMFTVWVNRGHSVGVETVVPDSTIGELTGITKIVEQKH